MARILSIQIVAYGTATSKAAGWRAEASLDMSDLVEDGREVEDEEDASRRGFLSMAAEARDRSHVNGDEEKIVGL